MANAGPKPRPRPVTSKLRDFEVKSTVVRNNGDVRQEVVSRAIPSSLSEWTPQNEEFEGQSLWEKPSSPLSKAQGLETKPSEPEATLSTENLGNIPWAVALALDERRMENEGVVEVSSSFRKQELLKIRTREFIQELHRGFSAQVEVFNEARRQVHAQIRVFKVSGTENDFMLFRNGVRLLVSGARAGRVSFAFNQYLGQVFAPTTPPQFELEALWGAFDQLHWTFKGERVISHDVIRYLMTEFSRQSCR